MADATIANLTDGVTAVSTDRIPVERSPFGAGTNRYITPGYVLTWIQSGWGTGVATALGVNVGSAGAVVVNGGALGTPSSGVATNLTGTASGLTAGNVTTNANLTGIVTSTGNATAIADKAISYTKLADGTAGNLITWDANGVAALVATGTATHVLTSNGAGAAPTFQAPTGGSGQSFVKGAAAPNSDHDITNGGAGGTVTTASKALTIAAGDQVIFEAEYYILNDSGAARNYTTHFSLGSFAGSIGTGNTFGASATNRQQHSLKVVWGVTSTSKAASRADLLVGQQIAADTRGPLNTTYSGFQWETSGSDLTGSQTASIGIATDNTTATQTLTLVSWRISVIPGV